jgi:hypothetical protein
MDGPGSVRAARERLAQAQALKRAQQQKEQQERLKDTRSPSPFMVPRLQPGAVRSPVKTEVLFPPTNGTEVQYGQQSPQWPLPASSGPPRSALHGNPITPGFAPAPPVKDNYNLQQVSSNSTKGSSQPSNGNRSDEMIPISLSERSQSHSPDLGVTKDSRTLSQTTVSSLGTIPDFPVASNFSSPEQTSRAQMALKVQTTNYPQFSVVSPIAEEKGSRASIKSYASSHAIPGTVTDFFYDESPSDEDVGMKATYQPYQPPVALLRQASVGRRVEKPAVTSIKARSKPLPTPGSDLNRGPSPPMQLTSARYDPKKADLYAQDLDSYLGDLEKGSDSDGSLRQVPRSRLSERVGTKVPNSLDFEKPKAQEVRGSITSLPELIKRATKLRSNLDHGRTASRLDFSNGWAIPEHKVVSHEKREAGDLATSPADSTTRTDWPSGISGKTMLPRHRRRFAFAGPGSGWSFNPASSRKTLITFIIILIVLITAAIIIPVVLIVIPKQHASTAAASNASCQKTLICANNGLPLQLPDGTCACACVDGFQGITCKIKIDTTCATINTDGGDSFIAGASVLPLLKVASNYSIPLDAKLLNEEFKKTNMTCATENSLVSLPSLAPSNNQAPKDQSATTVNGIVVAGTPTPAAAAASPSTTSSAPAVTSLPMFIGPGTNSSSQEFARVGILFILQDSQQLDTATTAQKSLISFMDLTGKNGSTRSAATDVSLGNGYSINMWDFSIKTRNGTVYGNKR